MSFCEAASVGSPRQCVATEDLGRGKEMETEKGMVLFNVPAGAQLKVR